MNGLLFLFEVAAVVLVALWVWGKERPAQRRRVTLFDMVREVDPEPPAKADGPAWKRARSASS